MNPKRQNPPVADSDDGSRVFAATVDDDVLTEILLRLPTKSATRFRAVCKNWFSLISSDQFRHLHTLRRRQSQPSLLLVIPPSGNFYFNPMVNGEKVNLIPFNFNVPYRLCDLDFNRLCNLDIYMLDILSSCNGLMLLRFANPLSNLPNINSPNNCYHYDLTYVYNPTTKQSRKIIMNPHSKYSIEGLKLAFDPSKLPHYKIVCLRRRRKRSPELVLWYQIEVYDSVSCTWKLCTEPFIDSKEQDFSTGVYCNNSIYWKTYDAIKYFDIDKNAIGSLPHPEIPWLESQRGVFRYSRLQESNGHLHYFLIDDQGESVALWELQGGDDLDHSQWFLKVLDRVGHLPSTFGSRFDSTPLRFIRGSDGEETSILLIYAYGKIRAYRFLDKSFQEIVDFSNQSYYLYYLPAKMYYDGLHQFGESLALV